jgi:hypothetical protein
MRADRARCARLVAHHDRLAAEIARRMLRKVARGEVGVASGGERHDEVDRPRWILRVQHG